MLKQGCLLTGTKPFGLFVFPREILVELNVFHSPVDPLATPQQGATQMRYGFYLPVVVAEVMVPAESRMNPKLRRQLRQGLLP